MTTTTTNTAATLLPVDDPTDGLVRSSAFGRLVAEAQGRVSAGGDGPPVTRPYSDQSVRNWRDAGYVTPVHRDARGCWYDPDDAAALAAKLPEPTHGGPREGAGRKKTTPGPGPLERIADDARRCRDALDRFEHEEAAVAAGELDADDPGRKRTTVDELLVGFDVDELRLLLASDLLTGSMALTGAKHKLFNEALKSRKMLLEIRAEEGTLVAADDVVRAWAAALAPVRSELERLPAALAAPVADAAWVPPETVDRLCSLLHREGVDPDTLEVVRNELARPLDLTARLTAVAQRALERARAAAADAADPQDRTP